MWGDLVEYGANGLIDYTILERREEWNDRQEFEWTKGP